MREKVVVSGSASINFSINLARELGCTLSVIKTKRYPDDECYIRIQDDLTEKDVIFVQTTYPDPAIIEFMLTIDAIREYDIAKLIAVIPYFGYARQDKKFRTGEAVSARALAKRVQIGIDEIVTIDIHEEKILKEFDIPASNLSAMNEIGRFLLPLQPDLVLAPDRGAVELAKTAADALGCGWDYLEKTRLDGKKVVVKPKSLDAKDKCVAIVDDIISTGGTIATAAEQLTEQGAKKVFAACTHGLFVNNAYEGLKNYCTGIFATDTIKNDARALSAAPSVVGLLRERLR